VKGFPLALLLLAAQLAAIGVPCPVAPLWKQIDTARAVSTSPPCPGHTDGSHAGEDPRSSMVFRCPCGCSDGLPPASGVHHSRAAVLPAGWEIAATLRSPVLSRDPALFAPQHDPSGIRHVPRAV